PVGLVNAVSVRLGVEHGQIERGVADDESGPRGDDPVDPLDQRADDLLAARGVSQLLGLDSVYFLGRGADRDTGIDQPTQTIAGWVLCICRVQARVADDAVVMRV